MNAERLLEVYEQISEAPDAIARLRRFVLDLAVRGKLVEQDAGDEPASLLLKRVAEERNTAARKQKALPEIDGGALGSIPPNWMVVPLIALGNWAIGSGFPKSEQGQTEGPHFFLKVSDMNLPENEKFITVANNCIDDAAATRMKAKIHPAGTIIFPKIGGAISTNKRRVLTRGSAIDNNCLGITFSTHIASEWAYLLLSSLDFTLYQAGTAVPALQQARLAEIPVLLPPLAEQHRMVAKVDELMALCDRLEEARKTREELRDKLTAASLARLTAPGTTAQAEPAKVGTGFASGSATTEDDFPTHAAFALEALPALTTRPDQIKTLRQTILNLAVRGRLPHGEPGRFEPVGKFRKLQNGYAFKSGWFAKSGVRLLRNANVGHGEIRWADTVYLPNEMADEYERFQLNEGDVVLTLDRPFIVTGTKVARITAADLPSLLLQRVGRFITIKDGLADDYLFMWINSPHFNDQIDPGRSNGVPHISSKQVEAAEIFVPALEEQRRIVAKVDTLMSLCDQLEAALTTTDSTRSRLLESLLHEALDPAAETVTEAAE